MLPVVAIVGRPNVGKSTLFNQFTKSRAALVADIPGVTRDRQYGEVNTGERRFILIDTGGVGETEQQDIDGLMEGQSWQAVYEADVIIFLLDAKAGVTAADENIVTRLRQVNKPILVVANKIDGVDAELAVPEFYQLGLGEPLAIAASHNRGTKVLLDYMIENFFPEQIEEPDDESQGVRLAVVGKPNVGKSTLINRMLGEERLVAYDKPGTTRDSIEVPFEHQGQKYTLIDTAGVRRRSRVDETLEKFSVIKTLQAIESANVVIFVIDAQDGVSEQDCKLLSFVIEAGKALVVAINKWDGMQLEQKEFIKKELERRLGFVDFARLQLISALHGTGVGDLYGYVMEAYRSSMRQVSTAKMTEILEQALTEHQPPLVKGRRVKIRYAHQGGKNPPVIVLHGNQLNRLPASYKRFLLNHYRKRLHLIGTPIRLVLKTTDNPYAK